jgi:hypothetical protein
MTLDPRNCPIAFSVLCGCLALAVAASLPIWHLALEHHSMTDDGEIDPEGHTYGTARDVLIELPNIIEYGPLTEPNLKHLNASTQRTALAFRGHWRLLYSARGEVAQTAGDDD